MKLYDSDNNPVSLGEKFGTGGEGSVYTIANNPNYVAKIYHQAISSEKSDKIQAMVVNKLDLPDFTAWPISALKRQNRVVGFLMPKVFGCRELHELYGPAHRKKYFPSADWPFLIFTARNLASIFGSVHSYNHVIGDVNQRGILVSEKATCKLIDTDSFQISLGQKIYTCDVGTPHFIPPELQGKALRGVIRTQNHDNFGLAVLIFQLVFMGRHPFAGRYLGAGDMPIEKAIKDHRFAFGLGAASKQIKPPPNAVGLSTCSSELASLFELAFSEAAASTAKRPDTKAWITALDHFLHSLKQCTINPVHKYYRELSSCPWCYLEGLGITYFYLNSSVQNSVQQLDIDKIWSKIVNIKIPDLSRLPVVNSNNYSARPLPNYAVPPTGLFGVLNAVFDFHDDRGERRKRESTLWQFKQAWDQLESLWLSLQFDGEFNQIRSNLERIYYDYQGLSDRYKDERSDCLTDLYLKKFLIEDAYIENIGKKRALVLENYGIETAADVDYDLIIQIPGFGEVLTQNLVDWRNRLVSQLGSYRFSPQELQQAKVIDEKYNILRLDYQQKLKSGMAALQKRREIVIKKREQIYQDAESLAAKLAQAQADMRVYS